MRVLVFVILFQVIYLAATNVAVTRTEEFYVYSPTEFHDEAIKMFVKMKKDDPKDVLDDNSPFLAAAKAEAIKRFRMKPAEDLGFQKTKSLLNGIEHDSPISLQLPSPDSKESQLQAAINARSSSAELVPAETNAMAIQFVEDIGTGALSRAGALAIGDRGEWVEYAENKLKRENELDYHSLLWEMGLSLMEQKTFENNGINITKENNLLADMKTWFLAGGGKMKFVDPIFESGQFKLRAIEDINAEDVVLTVPMKLILCQQTARNVLIAKRGKYLGEELTKTFEKNEVWGLAIILLHEYYKEIAGDGSKWGPFLRTLRMRVLTTEVIQHLRGTLAADLHNDWINSVDSLYSFALGIEGPCGPSSGICKSKPKEHFGDSRFNIHQLRWAYWIVKQNAVRVRHATTGYEFLALVPFYGMIDKRLDSGGSISFDIDGSIAVRIGQTTSQGHSVGLHPGSFSDSEFFLRYYQVPKAWNNNTSLKLKLPGSVSKKSKFHFCLKGTEKQKRSDECMGSYRSDVMFWKTKVLSEWRNLMNLPPRLQELRSWATRLHIYGGKDEIKLLTTANQIIAGLPIPVDEMDAEEQIMLLGLAGSSEDAALLLQGPKDDRPPPQLYSAPDPEEDPEARKVMEELAYMAAQAQQTIYSGNLVYNATRLVLNQTRDFFIHGVLPNAGLDELDNFLLKKIGMLSHCGFEEDMKITTRNVSKELMCAMRVHLMSETEMSVFCPAEAFAWQDNCLNVEFMNYTAISMSNELNVISAFQGSISSMLGSYPTTVEEDRNLINSYENDVNSVSFSDIVYHSIRLRLREKELLLSALEFLDAHASEVNEGKVEFQLEAKMIERNVANARDEVRRKFMEYINTRAADNSTLLATLEVNMGDAVPKQLLSINKGEDIRQVVTTFCKKNDVSLINADKLESSLAARVASLVPTSTSRLELILGVVLPTGDRKLLGIAPGTNITVEVTVFCTRVGIVNPEKCESLEQRVRTRLDSSKFNRRVILTVPITAPDSRKLLVDIREGDQHELSQVVADFLEYHGIFAVSVAGIVNEIKKRLPEPVLTIPVNSFATKPIQVSFFKGDNITNVVEVFANIFDIDNNSKHLILNRARSSMSAGSFIV